MQKLILRSGILVTIVDADILSLKSLHTSFDINLLSHQILSIVS